MTDISAPPLRAPAPTHPTLKLLSDFSRSRPALLALIVFTLLILAALTAPWITPQNPYDLNQIDVLDARLAPGTKGYGGMTYWLGTDDQGRDLLSGILYGLQTSLMVGLTTTAVALAIGLTVGLIAAYMGGRFDNLLMRLVDLQLSFPAVLLALILLAILGNGIDKVIIALVAAQWAYYARTVRSSAMVERRKEYVEAARSLALSDRRVLFGHILPNALPPVIVVAALNMAHAISLEATLSFLGVGAPVTEPSLGRLIANGYAYMLSGEYWISVLPGVALLITIVSINMIGDRLRDLLNPRGAR